MRLDAQIFIGEATMRYFEKLVLRTGRTFKKTKKTFAISGSVIFATGFVNLLAFRKAHPALRLQSREEVLSAVMPVDTKAPLSTAYLIDNSIFVVFNASKEELTITLPDGCWEVKIQDKKAGITTSAQAEGCAHAAPISTTVLIRK